MVTGVQINGRNYWIEPDADTTFVKVKFTMKADTKHTFGDYDGSSPRHYGDPDTEHLGKYPLTIKECYPLKDKGTPVVIGRKPRFDLTKLMSRLWQLQYEGQLTEGKMRAAWHGVEPPTWEDRLNWSIEDNRAKFREWLDNRVRPYFVRSTEFVITKSVPGGIGDCFQPFVIHVDGRDIGKLGMFRIPGTKYTELVDKYGGILYVQTVRRSSITVYYRSAYGNTLQGFVVGDKLRVREF